jgi:hypothetical protein
VESLTKVTPPEAFRAAIPKIRRNSEESPWDARLHNRQRLPLTAEPLNQEHAVIASTSRPSHRALVLVALVILSVAGTSQAQTTSARAAMPTPRHDLGMVDVGDVLYAIGGRDANSVYVGTVEAYDADSNAWTTRAAMPTARAGFGLAVVDGLIYVVGGETSGGAATASVEAYSPASNAWTTRASLPAARAKAAVSVRGGVIYVVGGVGANGQPAASVEVYDPAANRWSHEIAKSGQTGTAGGGVTVVVTYGGESTTSGSVDATALPLSSAAVAGKTGYGPDSAFIAVPADESGIRHVQLPELGRLELRFASVEAAYLIANGRTRELPTGARLDAASGTFSWGLCAGYLGTYQLAFVSNGERIPVEVTVRPLQAAVEGESEVRMFVDLPQAEQVVSGPVTVAGWALDPQADIGSGIDAVHVWARRTDLPGAPDFFLGAAQLGVARTDVGNAFGPQFDQAGYTLTASALAPGRYAVTVFVWNRRTARWEDARTVTMVAF